MRLHFVASVVSVVKPFCVLRLRRAEPHEALFRGWRLPRSGGIATPAPLRADPRVAANLFSLPIESFNAAEKSRCNSRSLGGLSWVPFAG
jgi:hypothetical protein